MNVMMSVDSRACPGAELVIYSMLTHNKHVNWYIFTMDIIFSKHGEEEEICYIGVTQEQKLKLRKIVQYLDPSSNITFINAAPYYAKYLAGSVNEFSNFTPYAALRLIADKALPHISHILYLDCDVAICENIEEMYFSYASNNSHAAYATYAEDAFEGEGEMVSGIMFFNLDRCRKEEFFDRARFNYMRNLYPFPDQMAMRDASKIGYIPSKYGCMEDPLLTNFQPSIIHFTNKLTKVYYAPSVSYFYRLYPQFDYVYKGLQLLDTIDFNIPLDENWN
jgi:lipopolysaccharide biosynthesis glycosyltransferase